LTPFGVEVTSTDKQDTSAVTPDDVEKLKMLNLPQYRFIEKIVGEIKQRDLYSKID